MEQQRGTEALIQMMESTQKEHEINQQINELIDAKKEKQSFEKMSVRDQMELIRKKQLLKKN